MTAPRPRPTLAEVLHVLADLAGIASVALVLVADAVRALGRAAHRGMLAAERLADAAAAGATPAALADPVPRQPALIG